MMRKALNFSVAAGVLFMYPLTTPVFAGKSCTSTSTEAAHTGSNSAVPDDDGYCFQSPQQMNIRLYEFGLCTSASSPLNKINCSSLFTSQTGQEINLSVGSVNSLVDVVTLVEGQYTHGYIVLSNLTSIKTVIEFNAPRLDDRGGLGKFCFTDGRSVNDEPEPPSIMSCGDDATQAVPSDEVIGFFAPDSSDHSSSSLGYTVEMQGSTVVTDLYMISSDGTLSTSFEDDFAIYGSQRLLSPVIIEPQTGDKPIIDIGFSVTDGVVIGFGGDRPDDAVFEGLKFNVSIN